MSLSNGGLVAVSDYGEFADYLRQVNSFPMLTVEEEVSLAERFQTSQDLEAAHRLVTSHLRLVVRIAREYQGYGLRLMDLIQEGSVGLMQAVKRFDPSRGFRLATYAMWWIRAAIHEFILGSWSMVKIATTAAQRKLFFSLRKCKETIELLDDASAATLAAKLGVDPRTLIEMDRRLAAPDLTLNRVVVEEGEELQNLLPDRCPNQESRLLEYEAASFRRDSLAAALRELDPRERKVIESRFLAESPPTLEELGSTLGVSRERVRQLEQRALGKLRKNLGERFAGY